MAGTWAGQQGLRPPRPGPPPGPLLAPAGHSARGRAAPAGRAERPTAPAPCSCAPSRARASVWGSGRAAHLPASCPDLRCACPVQGGELGLRTRDPAGRQECGLETASRAEAAAGRRRTEGGPARVRPVPGAPAPHKARSPPVPLIPTPPRLRPGQGPGGLEVIQSCGVTGGAGPAQGRTQPPTGRCRPAQAGDSGPREGASGGVRWGGGAAPQVPSGEALQGFPPFLLPSQATAKQAPGAGCFSRRGDQGAGSPRPHPLLVRGGPPALRVPSLA